MLQYEKQSVVFLPPINRSKNRLETASNSPVIIENNINKKREHIEVSVDKFSMLTHQPRDEFNIKLSTYSPRYQNNRLSALNLPITPITVKWRTKQVPMLKLKPASQDPKIETLEERRQRIIFEQKRLMEEKLAEKTKRNQRSMEFKSHSDEVRRKFRMRSLESSPNRSRLTYDDRFDIWGSDNFKDIALQKEIIRGFYETENRRIREVRNSGIKEFFQWNENPAFDALKDKLVEKNEDSKDSSTKKEN